MASARLNERLALLVILPAREPVGPLAPILRVPALMVVLPVYVLVPLRVRVPVPNLVSLPVPANTPLKDGE